MQNDGRVLHIYCEKLCITTNTTLSLQSKAYFFSLRTPRRLFNDLFCFGIVRQRYFFMRLLIIWKMGGIRSGNPCGETLNCDWDKFFSSNLQSKSSYSKKKRNGGHYFHPAGVGGRFDLSGSTGAPPFDRAAREAQAATRLGGGVASVGASWRVKDSSRWT